MPLQAKQTAQQRLMLAPNVTLALEVLRMPLLELQTFLEQEAQENPLLELEQSDAPQDEDSTAPQEAESNEAPESPTDLTEEWASHWATVGEREDPDTEEFSEDRRGSLTKPPSLHEWLRTQLGCQPISADEQARVETLIQHLDDNGYVDTSLEDLARETGSSLEQLERALALIQRCDPPGVGARTLQECLMIQLQQQHPDDPASNTIPPAGTNHHPVTPTSLASRILQDYFPLFLHHRIQAIAKATGASLEQATHACEVLSRLNPKPGGVFSGDLSPSLIPDLVIHHREQHCDVELNDQHMPHITISRFYYRMLKDPRTPSEAKAFLVERFRKASWLIKAIDERNTTVLSIARCLISLQREFLDSGPRALKPLTQAQVAALVGRHPSTVSRAIAGKTIDTPYGIFPLEQLFASSVPQPSESNGISDETIKAEIQRLIEEEDPACCLSDAEITNRLAQRNIMVARRTIAKYRAALKILPAHLRKRRL